MIREKHSPTMVPRMTWCDRFSHSCRSGSRFEYAQADSTISTNRPRSWKCVRARVLTSRPEEIWMIQMKAFLSPVPLNVGPSVESRGLDSPLLLGIISEARCPGGRIAQGEGNDSRCDCKHDSSRSR